MATEGKRTTFNKTSTLGVVFDIEANGLYFQADKIWCISYKLINLGLYPDMPLGAPLSACESFTDEMGSQGRGTLKDCLERLSGLSTEYSCSVMFIGHNIINYDFPLLKKLYGWTINENDTVFDTLVVSNLLNPDRPRPSSYTGKGGPHSLECWGYRVGKAKPDHEEWSVFSPAMLRRNREDVEINVLVYNSLISEMIGWDWTESLELEHAVARIISQQEKNGVYFDRPKAEEYITQLTGRVEQIDREWVPRIPGTIKQRGTTVLHPFNSNGSHSGRYREDISFCSGPFTRVDYVPINLGSAEQVKNYLLSNGWEPDEWNINTDTGERTSPKLSGEFRGIEGELPSIIKERISVLKRKSLIEGWLSLVRDDGRITAGAITNGTNTGRMRHMGVVNVPKANKDKEDNLIWDTELQKDFFGTQMRSLFCTAPNEDTVLVGHDAAGLELRMLAHYMNDPEYTEVILNGDIHTYNQQAGSLPTRDNAKSFIYAFLYGAGDEKIGAVVGGTKTTGTQLRRKFLTAIPNLRKLIDRVRRSASRGFLKGLDGRKVWMRTDKEGRVMTHKALNTLLQSAGAVVMKKSMVILWDELIPQHNVKALKVIDMHDESQTEVSREMSELYQELAVRSIVMAGEYYKLNIPLDADAREGSNWAETH